MQSTNGPASLAAEFDAIHVAIYRRRKPLNKELAAARNATQRAAARAKIDALKDEWLREWRAFMLRAYGAEYCAERASKIAWASVVSAWQLKIEEGMADFIYDCRHCDFEIRVAGVDEEHRYKVDCMRGGPKECWIKKLTPEQWGEIGNHLKGAPNE